MTRNEQLSKWLENRQRTYADGLSLFNDLAKSSVQKKFGAYFTQATEHPHIFDPHFTQLIHELNKITREIREAPSLYPAAFEEIAAIKALDNEELNQEIITRKENLIVLQGDIDDLNTRIDSLQGDSDDYAEELAALRIEFDEKMKEMATLRSELDVLNTPGVKIVTEESLTPALRKAYQRIKEITPLYASLHNDIATPDTPEEKRKELAEELCKLDDERRKLWKQIDDYAEGKSAKVNLDEQRPTFSNNSTVRGFEIARQIKRLKQNIINSSTSAERAKKDGKQAVYQNALDRIARYEQELAALEAEISAQGETIAE